MEFIRKARKGMPLPQVDERPTKLEKGKDLKNPKIPWVFPEKNAETKKICLGDFRGSMSQSSCVWIFLLKDSADIIWYQLIKFNLEALSLLAHTGTPES